MIVPRHILVIQTAFIGDAILATAILEKLHHHFPTATLDFLVRKGNEGLFVGHPFLHDVLIWDKKKSKYQGLWQLLRRIRGNRYDLVINLQRFGATGLLTAFSGAGTTIGFDKNPFSMLFTHRIKHVVGGVHEVERNTALVAPLTDDRVFRPKLYPPPLRMDTPPAYVCIAPTSVWFTKQFPEHKWVAFIQQLPPSLPVYLLGAVTDLPTCERIKAAVTGPHDIRILAGQISLLESAALMQKATMNYVNDSAPMHLCSATNAPVCAVYCSTIPDFGFGPLSDRSTIIQTPSQLACRPCGLHGHNACPKGHFECAESINEAQLLSLM